MFLYVLFHVKVKKSRAQKTDFCMVSNKKNFNPESIITKDFYLLWLYRSILETNHDVNST